MKWVQIQNEIEFFRYIKRQVLLNGATGKVAFDDNGDRINAEYDIVNVISDKRMVPVGKYFYANVSDHPGNEVTVLSKNKKVL